MTKRICSFLLIMALFSPSCVKVLKNVNDYYPQVKTTSVVVNSDGSVTVSGEVTSTGSTGIQYCGFCMDTIPNPDMLTNQSLATNLNGNVFSCTYSSLNALSTYYFKAFAANANGYAIGSAISVSNAGFDTALIPCHPVPQYVALTGANTLTEPFQFVDSATQSATGYEVYGTTGDYAVDIVFSQYPTSGIYTGSNATVTFNAMAVSGVTLYVQQISSGVIDITICQANVQVQDMYGNYHPYVMASKFRSPS
jgi:hypothetical protein